MAENQFGTFGCGNSDEFKEAVCIDAARIYDSCGDKDCLADLRVYFTDVTQPIIDTAYTVKAKNVDVASAYLSVSYTHLIMEVAIMDGRYSRMQLLSSR